MRVVVVVGPDPVVSLAEAKAHLQVEHDDDDALIASYVAAATGRIDGLEGWLGRAIGVQTLEARFWTTWCGAIRMPYPPLINLVSVKYLDGSEVEQTADLADFELFGSEIAPRTEWPWRGGSLRREAIRVRYRAGYAVLPAAIRVAILLMVGDLYCNRETVALGSVTQVPMSITLADLLEPFWVPGR